MSLSYSITLLVFGIVAYMIIVDKNVAKYFLLIFKILEINYKKYLWIITNHPRNPIINLIKRWEYEKIARELQEELITYRIFMENDDNSKK